MMTMKRTHRLEEIGEWGRAFMPKAFVLMALGLSISQVGCSSAPEELAEDPWIKNCVAHLELSLRSPSTLKVVETDRRPYETGHQDVQVSYDAANAFGAPVRSRFLCIYEPWDKKRQELGLEQAQEISWQYLSPAFLENDGKRLSDADVAVIGARFVVEKLK